MTEWTCVAERAGVAAWQMGNQTAPLVVMVHGMEDTWNSFERMARIMTAEGRCRTIAFDLPWRSGADPTWFDEAGPVEWLRSALELVDGPIECVIGHSFGANTVLELIAAGMSWRAVVLLAPYYRPSDVAASSIEREAREVLDTTVVQGLRARLGERDVPTDIFEFMSRGLVGRVGPLAFPVFFDSFERSGHLNLSGDIPPTLILSGSHDPALKDERAAALTVAMPGARFERRPHLPHPCHITAAEELASDALEFLNNSPTIPHSSEGLK